MNDADTENATDLTLDHYRDQLDADKVDRIAETLRATGRYGSEAAEVVTDVLAAAVYASRRT